MYDAERRWLSGITTTLPSGTIQALQYEHYDNGQLHKEYTSGGASSPVREYQYNAVSALAGLVDTQPGEPSVTTSFGYDARGNRTSFGSGANPTQITRLQNRPHLVASVGENGYAYDLSGNVVTRSGPDIPGGVQTFEWTPFDLPKKITTGGVDAEFEYSADEERVLRRDVDTTRYFATDLYQRVADTAGNTLEERFSLNAGGRAIGEIVRKPSGDQTLYFHTDQKGTAEVVSTSSGDWTRREYDAWGAPQFSSSDDLTRAGYTGHQHDDDLGLIDMRGRIYDPLAGSFLTPDPIMQAPFWTQGLNRYSYVFNDPMNATDPSGFAAKDFVNGLTGWMAELGATSAYGIGSGGGATAGGLAGGTFAVGAANIYSTVSSPNFGGASAGSSSSAVSLYSNSAMSQALEQSLSDAPNQKVACYPACLPDPNSAFPDTEAGQKAKKYYFYSYEAVGALLSGGGGLLGLLVRLPVISGGLDAFGMWRFTWAGGGYASFMAANGRVIVDYINRGAAAAGQAGQMLATAIQQAGITRPTELFVSNVLQKYPNSNEVVANALRQAASSLGGTVTSVTMGVDAGNHWIRLAITY